MKKGKDTTNRINVNKLMLIVPFLFFLVISIQMARLSLSTTIDGINLKQFANNRNTKKDILYANRGTIYSYNGGILAQNVDSYTVIAYLSPKRSEGFSTPRHVVDKEKTAEALESIINMDKKEILRLLNKENLYQVELRPGGVGITELKKEEIQKLELPGIDFIQTFKRYYPNNDFLAYTLGYVQMNDDLKIKGQMGIEKYYNKELSGKDGYLEYQKDLNGYKIPNTPEVRDEEEDGNDIYLTIDDNVQLFTERVVKESTEKYGPDWMLMTVVDAKTGAVLGTTSTPSFNPNIKNIENYLNPLVSYTFEPGSTMKAFTYMAAMEKGTYKGNNTFKSGKIEIGDDTISDWKPEGWGNITYDQGFALSSNVGIANMVQEFINRKDLKDYFMKLGFGKKTGFTLPNEQAGIINFKYDVEVANAGFGQGITVTPIQFVQALTAIANDGVMLKPYIVEKIVNPNTNQIVYTGGREEIETVASKETVEAIKELMYQVVHGDPNAATGYNYKVEGYDLIAKTGTAQYVDPNTGRYQTGKEDYIRSFAGMFPKDDPEIIIYALAKRPDYGASTAVASAVKKLVVDVAKYYNIKQDVEIVETSDSSYVVPNFINNNTIVMDSIDHQNIVIGDGDKIINQYPKANEIINDGDTIFVLTNSKDIILPKMTMWSSREVNTYCSLINIKCNIEGYGYVYSQDISEGTSITKIEELNLKLKRTSSKVEL
ncbi:MAG: penicillin-binding transpeptidase domain-containing protein [Bacilli bacterium]|nr:penicillin-binding transpeptidase domain-containing protein [Bacilli bacterium]